MTNQEKIERALAIARQPETKQVAQQQNPQKYDRAAPAYNEQALQGRNGEWSGRSMGGRG